MALTLEVCNEDVAVGGRWLDAINCMCKSKLFPLCCVVVDEYVTVLGRQQGKSLGG